MIFDFNKYEPTIKETGYWQESVCHYSLNYSTILTKLIQQCGRLCDRYASDLFIDWNSVMQKLEEYKGTPDEPDEEDVVFGIRRDGVDGNAFVESRYTQSGRNADHCYRDIYLLRIVRTGDKISFEFGMCESIGYLNKLPW